MRVWKIRHKPTGLFFKPSGNGHQWEKSNLGKQGKLYERSKPTLKKVRGRISVSRTLVEKLGLVVEPKKAEWHTNYLITKEDDWEVVEYELVEVNK
jgi:hypothetical protein